MVEAILKLHIYSLQSISVGLFLACVQRLSTKLKLIVLLYFLLFKAKSIRFCNFINIHRPFDFALKSALRLGFVVLNTFYLFFGCGIGLDKSNGISFFLKTPLFLKCFAMS